MRCDIIVNDCASAPGGWPAVKLDLQAKQPGGCGYDSVGADEGLLRWAADEAASGTDIDSLSTVLERLVEGTLKSPDMPSDGSRLPCGP